VLYDLIRYTGISQAAKDVVKGTFFKKHGDELKDILPETEQLIKKLSMEEEIKFLGKKIDYEITEETFISGFKKWKESTLMSSSGCQLGHYKAIVTDLDIKLKEPEQEHLCKHKTNFIEAHYDLVLHQNDGAL
jgi:hypothetical protein